MASARVRSMTKRIVLAAALLLALAAATFLGWQSAQRDRAAGSLAQEEAPLDAFERLVSDAIGKERPRNVILVVADGMGFPHLMLARARLVGLQRRLFVETLPVVGWQTTYAADAIVTDSAASASSMATGQKVRRRALSVDGRGKPLRTIFEAAADRGLRTGALTDTIIWDATPAAFLAHVADRNAGRRIVEQMAASQVSFLAGGDDGVDDDVFRRAGFRVAHSLAELDAIPEGSRSVGLFPPGAIADGADRSRLPDLVERAVRQLRNDSGFLLLVETEEVDSGAHAGDIDRVVRGVRGLDRTVARCVDLARGLGETTIVVTSDHETGGLALVPGSGDRLRVSWGAAGRGFRTSRRHTAAPVPVFAAGLGAERFAGVGDNTDIADKIAALLDLDWHGGSATGAMPQEDGDGAQGIDATDAAADAAR